MQEERADALATDFWAYQQRTLLEAEGQTPNPLFAAARTGCSDVMLYWVRLVPRKKISED